MLDDRGAAAVGTTWSCCASVLPAAPQQPRDISRQAPCTSTRRVAELHRLALTTGSAIPGEADAAGARSRGPRRVGHREGQRLGSPSTRRPHLSVTSLRRLATPGTMVMHMSWTCTPAVIQVVAVVD